MVKRRNTQTPDTKDTPVQEEVKDEVVQKEEVQEETKEVKVNTRVNEPKIPSMYTAPDKKKGDPYWLEPGDIISLNMKQRAMIMFPLPGGRIFRLNSRLWNGEIPTDTPPEWLKALRLLFEQGDVVKGKQFLPKYPKNPEIMKKYFSSLELSIQALTNKLKPLVLHRGLIEGYRSAEIIMAMMRYEQEHYHRKQYIDILNEALEHIGGPGPITQSPVQNLDMSKVEEISEDIF